MNYTQMLRSEITYYTKKGFIPQLKIGEMSYREMEMIVDYCFTIEQYMKFEEFSNNTTLGYHATEDVIKKIIKKRSINNDNNIKRTRKTNQTYQPTTCTDGKDRI